MERTFSREIPPIRIVNKYNVSEKSLFKGLIGLNAGASEVTSTKRPDSMRYVLLQSSLS